MVETASVRTGYRMRYPCPEILLRIASFDAYAVAAENVKDRRLVEAMRAMDPSDGYHRSPVYAALPAGCYTDDTERAVANARALLEPVKPGTDPTALNFANLYVDEFKRSGKREGYARGYGQLLKEVRSGRELIERLKPVSCRNGAMMGAGVLGALNDSASALRVATVQAAVTHNTPCGIFTARVAALATHYALYRGEPLQDLPAYLASEASRLKSIHEGEVDCGHTHLFERALAWRWPEDRMVDESSEYPIGLATIRAVLTIISDCKTLAEAMRLCLYIGGDTDTVAAIVASIMAPRRRGEELPSFLERDLERSDPWTGAQRLRQLGAALMHAYA